MTDPINTHNRLRGGVVGTDTKAGVSNKSAQQAPPAKGKSGPPGESTIVDLSNATLLDQLREQIDTLPEVNEARVEAVKRSLSNGEYQPDAEVIAQKYREIEKLLP